MNKRLFLGIGIVIFLSLAGYLGYQNYLAPIPVTPESTSQNEERQNRQEVVSAEGRVVPAQFVTLGFSSGGIVQEVMFSAGDPVKAGDVIARLDNFAQFQAAVTQANLQLISAQLAYDDLFENLDLSRALAQKAAADAEDGVRDAKRLVNNLNSPARQTDIDQAKSNVVLAEDKLDKAKDNFEPYENKSEDNLIRASLQSALAQTQADYDNAVRYLNNLEGTASEIDIAQAEADLLVAEASQANALRNLDDLKDGPDPDMLSLSEASLENAKAQLAAAEEMLAKQELRAPFSGTIVRLNLKVGEVANPSLTIVSLADFSNWHIETTDLAESDIGLLQLGYRTDIVIDAFPGTAFEGEIVEIGLLGEDRRGQITYPITIEFDPGDLPVRWEMTVFVDIQLP